MSHSDNTKWLRKRVKATVGVFRCVIGSAIELARLLTRLARAWAELGWAVDGIA